MEASSELYITEHQSTLCKWHSGISTGPSEHSILYFYGFLVNSQGLLMRTQPILTNKMPRFHTTGYRSQSTTWIHKIPPTSPRFSESTELLNFGRAQTHLGGRGRGRGNGGAAAGTRSEEATLSVGTARSPKSSAAGARRRRGIGGDEWTLAGDGVVPACGAHGCRALGSWLDVDGLDGVVCAVWGPRRIRAEIVRLSGLKTRGVIFVFAGWQKSRGAQIWSFSLLSSCGTTIYRGPNQ